MRTKCRKLNKDENIYNENTEEEIIYRNEINDVELQKISKGKIFEKIYNFFEKFGSFIYRVSIFLLKTSGIYLLWICLHYFSAHLYIKFCVPNTFFGFIMSPFMIATPHCQGLRWIVYNAANIINNMWILIGTWIYSMIWIFNKDSSNTTNI